MRVDFLQIGFEKCGTTFLETNVYPYHPHIDFVHAASYPELSYLLLRDFILADGLEYDRQRFEKNFAELCPKVFTNSSAQIKGIMFRAFTYSYERRFDRKSVIDRISESFPEAKIILPIRSQRTWLISLYWTYLRNGGLLGLYDFIEVILSNEMLVAHYIDWFPLVSYLYQRFGPDKVLVYPYEELRKSPQGLADKIFDFLGVPHVSIDESVVNASPSKQAIIVKRLLNHLVRLGYGTSNYNYNVPRGVRSCEPTATAKLNIRFAYGFYSKYTDRLCRVLDHTLRFKGRFKLDERHSRLIAQRYSASNQKLSELLGVDLSAHGYP